MRSKIRMTMVGALALGIMSTLAWGAPVTPPAQQTKAPAAQQATQGTVRVIATCNDGTEWRARSDAHQGACSRHKGVKSWADGSKVQPARQAPLNPVRAQQTKAPAK